MIDRHASLAQHLFDVAVAQRIGCVPADAEQNDIGREAHSFEAEHVKSRSVRRHSLPDQHMVPRQCDKTDQDHVDRKAHTFEVEHVDLCWIRRRSLPERFADAR
jgi:hypothetical protein